MNHPLASIRSLKDSKDCIAMLSALSVLGNRDGPFTVQRLLQLLVADAHFHKLLTAEQPAYFSQLKHDSQRAHADTFAKHIQLIHSHLAGAFQRYVIRHEDWSEGQGDLLMRTTGLAIANFGALVKWSYFLHETLKSTSWSELHALYFFAEQQGFQSKPLPSFAGDPNRHPSAQTLYLRALMLDILNPGSLTAAQIEIAESWLTQWTLDYSLDSDFMPRSHLIYVDLAEHAGFHLITQGVQGDSIRYLRADAMQQQIEEVKNELRQGRATALAELGEGFSVEEQAALITSIEKLYHSILIKSGNRVAERKEADDLHLEITLGFEAIAHASARSNGTLATAPLRSETWRVHDYSHTGFGFEVDRATGEVIPLQTLIAMRQPGGSRWAIGAIVRKLTNRVVGQTLVGVEMLGNYCVPIELARASAEADSSTHPNRALYVPGQDAGGRRDILVVRQEDFTAHNAFELALDGHAFQMRFNRAVKKGTDWIALRFEVTHKR